MKSISIVIVNYKSWIPLERCLDSISLQKDVDLEVIVVDNNSQDGKIQDFKSKYSSINWIESETNGGFAYACNLGESVAKNEFILFLNPDTILTDDLLKNLMNKNIDYSNKLISVKQFDKTDKNTHAYGYFLSMMTYNGIIRSIYRLIKGHSRSKFQKVNVFSPDWVSGSFVLISKVKFNEIGRWDERFWMYYEDMDLSKRARDNNMEIVMFNDLNCYHYHGLSSRVNVETKIITKTEVILSSLKFVKKHYSGLYKHLLLCLIVSSKLISLSLGSIVFKYKRGILKRFISKLSC